MFRTKGFFGITKLCDAVCYVALLKVLYCNSKAAFENFVLNYLKNKK